MDALLHTRHEIDQIDRDFLALLARRMEAIRSIAAYKREHPDEPLRDERREREVFEVWAREGETLGLSPYFVGRILREIMNYSRRDQERMLDRPQQATDAKTVRVGYQGAPGAYSDLAAGKLFATRAQGKHVTTGFHTFGAALDALEGGEVDYALLPIENTIAGSINEVYQLLAHRRVHVVDEEIWNVEHCLVGLPGTKPNELRSIQSHPVALQQCRRFLEGLVGVKSESYFDTAAACRAVMESEDPSIAAIASEEAAQRYGLEVLRRDIADEKVNITRFMLIALEPEAVDARIPAKSSLLFTTNHREGALAEVLQVFARHGINLTKLESRPQPASPWEYMFYVDVERAAADPQLESALHQIREFTNYLRVLGSYPNRSVTPDDELPDLPAAAKNGDSPANGSAKSAAGKTETGMSKTPPPEACVVPPKSDKLPLSTRNAAARTVVRVGDVPVGGKGFTLIAGPCAVESRGQIQAAAAMVRQHGAAILRGGAFKPRSSPYSFQGLGFEGLELLVEAGHAYEMPVVTEVLRPEDVDRIAERADMLQVGARNMQNFSLLKRLGSIHRPVLLKRGMSATVEELLQAAEYIMAGGNQQVILCERGIRTFETATRNTLDVSAVPVLKERTHLPIIVDPSHAAGVRHLVVPLALASVAAGADGLIVEAHPSPDEALCDKEQALTAGDLAELQTMLAPILQSQGRAV